MHPKLKINIFSDPLLPLKKVGLVVLFFIYIYSLRFIFVPGDIGTRAMIGVVGLLLLFIDVLHSFSKGKLLVKLRYVSITLCLVLIPTVSLLTNIWNVTSEQFFLTYPISIILVLAGAYPVTRAVILVYDRVDFELIAKYIIVAVVIQCIIALMMFILPAMRSFLIEILVHTDASKMHFDMEGFRLIGFGAQFFEAGVINCVALILIASLFKGRLLSIGYMLWLIFSFFIIFSIGMMMARTTIIGVPLAGAVLLYKSRFWKLRLSSKFLRAISSILIFSLLATVIIVSLPSSLKNEIEQPAEFGLEMFINYFEKGQFSSASTTQLFNMYDTYPDNAKTWIIGNGYWSDPMDRDSYYMSTDVGYARLIFYFGIIGLLFYFSYQVAIARSANRATGGTYKPFFVTLIALVLVLNLKGFTDMSSTFSLFLFISSDNTNRRLLAKKVWVGPYSERL